MKILSEYKYKGRLMYRLAGVLCALLFVLSFMRVTAFADTEAKTVRT